MKMGFSDIEVWHEWSPCIGCIYRMDDFECSAGRTDAEHIYDCPQREQARPTPGSRTQKEEV